MMKQVFLLTSLVCAAAFLPSAVFAKTAPAAKHAAPSMGKRDRNAPVEISADALEVFQQENRAVFTGHVVVIQGDVRLKADSMTVYYISKEQKQPDSKNKVQAAPATPDNGSIRKIDASGNVFLSTAQETASGAKGTYDVEHRKIFLNDNVVLTRGQNVLKGSNLVYDFDTGKSVLTSKDSGGAKAGGKDGGRVRALFVPNKDDKVKDKK